MKKGELFRLASPYSVIGYKPDLRVEYSGELRCPKKGEYYISGAIPEGYKALNDLATKYHIGVLVRVKIETVVTAVTIIAEDRR